MVKKKKKSLTRFCWSSWCLSLGSLCDTVALRLGFHGVLFGNGTPFFAGRTRCNKCWTRLSLHCLSNILAFFLSPIRTHRALNRGRFVKLAHADCSGQVQDICSFCQSFLNNFLRENANITYYFLTSVHNPPPIFCLKLQFCLLCIYFIYFAQLLVII